MATTVRVKNNKTGLERDVAYKAFTLLPKLYTPLAFYDSDGNEVENPALTPPTAKSVKKKPVEAVAGEVKRPPGRPKMTDEEREAKKAELSRLNEEALEKAKNKSEKA